MTTPATTTWLSAIDAHGFDGWTRMMMIREAPRTRFPGDIPIGFEALRGPFVDLGFDRLGLAAAELDAILLAFVATGVRVPGTGYRLRVIRPVLSVVEPVHGSGMATLPDHWRQGVLTAAASDVGRDRRRKFVPGDSFSSPLPVGSDR